jgi:hypothetical protein
LIEDARAQHTRVDTKASVLLGATGTLLAVVIAVLGVASKSRPGNPGLPITVLTLAWVGATLLAAALAHLAWAVRPMHTARGGGSPTDPSLLRALADGPSTAVDHIRRELADGDEAEVHRQMVRLGLLARHARTKHHLVRRATDLLLASLGVLIIAAVAYVLTH